MYYLVHLSDKVFCISDFSKEQLQDICKEHMIQDIPLLKTIHLGDSIVAQQHQKSLHKKRPHHSKYVMYVSTIEARKNHKLLLDVWSKLCLNTEDDMPHLVLVGMMGWGIDDVLKLYQENSTLKNSVHFYHDVSDEELSYLYQNALFTVFPSFVEGWGLGAVESLIYGKPCLISNCPALIEATQGLMPSLDPNAMQEWVECIQIWYRKPEVLEELKEKICKQFKPKSWKQFGQEFEYFIKEVQ